MWKNYLKIAFRTLVQDPGIIGYIRLVVLLYSKQSIRVSDIGHLVYRNRTLHGFE